MGNPTQTSYAQRSDLDKIKSQWRKLSGHMTALRSPVRIVIEDIGVAP